MRKILSVLLLVMMAGCTSTKYVMIDPKDSTKLVEVRKRIIYQDTYLESPMYFNYWANPLRFTYVPRIVIPIRPQYRRNPPIHTPQKPTPRGGRR